jgi:hypothetical protein
MCRFSERGSSPGGSARIAIAPWGHDEGRHEDAGSSSAQAFEQTAGGDHVRVLTVSACGAATPARDDLDADGCAIGSPAPVRDLAKLGTNNRDILERDVLVVRRLARLAWSSTAAASRIRSRCPGWTTRLEREGCTERPEAHRTRHQGRWAGGPHRHRAIDGLRVVTGDRNIRGEVALTENAADELGRFKAEIEPRVLLELRKPRLDLQARIHCGDAQVGASAVRYNADGAEPLDAVFAASVADLPSEYETRVRAPAAGVG